GNQEERRRAPGRLLLTGGRTTLSAPGRVSLSRGWVEHMRRSPIVAILMAALLVSGCASQPAILIPPGVDRNELMEAIARSGQADPEVGPAVPAERDRLTPLLE